MMRLTSGVTLLSRRLRRSSRDVCGKTPDAEIVKRLIVLKVEVKIEISAGVSSSVLCRPDGHREREDTQVRAARV
ncbi:MAG: hypothetical protein ACREXR_20285, partial [Gammaproteobacteria bacterium]